jgi:hypothetical protein
MLYFEFSEGITARAEYDDNADAIRVDFKGKSRHLFFYVNDSTGYDESEEMYCQSLCKTYQITLDINIENFPGAKSVIQQINTLLPIKLVKSVLIAGK